MTIATEIIKYLQEHPRSRPTTIAKDLQHNVKQVSATLRLLALEGKVVREDRGIWSEKED